MANQVDYQPFATGSNPNVDTQQNFLGSGYQQSGFQTGTASSAQFNKVWRQASMIAAAVANFISNVLNINVLDDGNLPALITNLTKAIRLGGSARTTVAYNAAAVFDASIANIFQTTLTGNMSPQLVNTAPGMKFSVSFIQDAVGNHTVTAPGNWPIDDIELAANSISTQRFVVLDNGTANGQVVKESGIIVT